MSGSRAPRYVCMYVVDIYVCRNVPTEQIYMICIETEMYAYMYAGVCMYVCNVCTVCIYVYL